MKTQAAKSPFRSLLISGAAIILFSTAGLARMMGWGLASTVDSGGLLALDRTAPALTASEARAESRCAECGEIVLVQELEGHEDGTGTDAAVGATAGSGDGIPVRTTRSYEITVRMADGSKRVLNDISPTRWRTGDRLIVIDGVRPPNR